MLTVSLHGIRIHAAHGLYQQEHITGNDFEVDVDVLLPTPNTHPLPFVDYVLINDIVAKVFEQPVQLLEQLAYSIHTSIKMNITSAEKIKVNVKKLHPPLSGSVAYARVCYEA